jgi:hypothetical protein
LGAILLLCAIAVFTGEKDMLSLQMRFSVDFPRDRLSPNGKQVYVRNLLQKFARLDEA